MRILMVAAENGALEGGKVGGIGDVIREVPRALEKAGHQVDVITPGYGRLTRNSGAELQHTLSLTFCGKLEEVALYRVPEDSGHPSVRCWLVEHPLFSACGDGKIYCDDHWGPFATDAHKFALFCHGVCHALVTGALALPDILHLHDWHAALLLFLRKYQPAHQSLQKIRTVYTIHNLSIQGVRPLAGNGSSLETWFNCRQYDRDLISDPVSADCVNMMRMGINLSDKIHVVSPNYAREVLRPSDPVHGFVGGEGLEGDLIRAEQEQRLFGILNGCEYAAGRPRSVSKARFIELALDTLQNWVGDQSHIPASYYYAQQRLLEWSRQRCRDDLVLAFIGRLTWQKAGLLAHDVSTGKLALEAMLDKLPGGRIIMLGSGDHHYQTLMSGVMKKHDNFIFLQGFSESLADRLYQFCDAFLMPSTFEPCGISQMLALRAGKPCLVHSVGGLADTVDEDNGFVFSGETPAQQASAMLVSFQRMLRMKTREQDAWQAKVRAARKSRFSWDESVQVYLTMLYS